MTEDNQRENMRAELERATEAIAANNCLRASSVATIMRDNRFERRAPS